MVLLKAIPLVVQREDLLYTLKINENSIFYSLYQKTIVVLYDLYRFLATPLPSEMFSRVMQDCHCHADIADISAECRAVAV